MPDWTKSMQQSYEYYIVDPDTWKDRTKLSTVKTSTIIRDSDAATLGSTSIEMDGQIDECYIRTYLVTIQNGITERTPLDTCMVQTPLSSFDGRVANVSADAYTPLIELKEKMPPIGYSLLEGENIMDRAYKLTRENARAPVVNAVDDQTLNSNFVAGTSETYVSYLGALIANADYKFGLDEMGRILFLPERDTASLQPVWTYNSGNSSILHPEFDVDHDMYGIPNVVEVVYSDGNKTFYSKAINDDPNSPTSTVNRRREIPYRITDPSLSGIPTQAQLDKYAEKVLKQLSTLEYTVSYKHGYCPVRLGDCVRLNYPQNGINNVKAKVIYQSIKCEPGCPVTEKAIFTIKLWG